MAGNFLTRAITTSLLPPFSSLFLQLQRTSWHCEEQIFVKWSSQPVLTYTLLRLSKLKTSLCLTVTGEVSTRRRLPGQHSAAARTQFPIHTQVTIAKKIVIISSTDKALCIYSKTKDNTLSARFYFNHSAEDILMLSFAVFLWHAGSMHSTEVGF